MEYWNDGMLEYWTIRFLGGFYDLPDPLHFTLVWLLRLRAPGVSEEPWLRVDLLPQGKKISQEELIDRIKGFDAIVVGMEEKITEAVLGLQRN